MIVGIDPDRRAGGNPHAARRGLDGPRDHGAPRPRGISVVRGSVRECRTALVQRPHRRAPPVPLHWRSLDRRCRTIFPPHGSGPHLWRRLGAGGRRSRTASDHRSDRRPFDLRDLARSAGAARRFGSARTDACKRRGQTSGCPCPLSAGRRSDRRGRRIGECLGRQRARPGRCKPVECPQSRNAHRGRDCIRGLRHLGVAQVRHRPVRRAKRRHASRREAAARRYPRMPRASPPSCRCCAPRWAS